MANAIALPLLPDVPRLTSLQPLDGACAPRIRVNLALGIIVIVSESMFNPYRYQQQLNQPFSFDHLYSHPGSLDSYDSQGSRQSIGIIGGGIAGLTCAYELSQLDHRVTLLEASGRLGGRIYTHYFSDSTHAELGAMRVPASHGCTLYYMDKFKLKRRQFVSYNPAAYYYLRGQKTRLDNYKSLLYNYHLTLEEQQDPAVIYETILEELIESLSNQEKWEMFSPSFTSSRLREYDSLSVTQYFRDRLSPDAFEFVGHATGMIHYNQVSLLNGLIDFFAWHRVEQYKLVGGMETLVNAFAERIPGDIQTQAQVTAIELTDSGVKLHWNSLQGKQSAEFDFVICTLPTTALAKIDFDPPLPAQQREAINSLGYCSAAKTLFHCTARPWEFEDGIYGGGSFTDLNIEKCWYPDDNAILADKQSDNPDWIACDRERSHQPSAFTAAYRWEGNSRKFRSLEEGDRTELTLREVKQLHPQIDQYVDDIVHYIWDEKAKLGSGSYAFFAPGEHERYQGWLGESYPHQQPRVFFAGEHLGINHASVQGAIQTAVSAVIELLETSILKF